MDLPPLEGLKVVSAEEMTRIENSAYQEGASEQTFVENAGKAIANAIMHFIEHHALSKTVCLLTGKGNNGADAFAAGAELIQHGFTVTAQPIFPKEALGSLCKIMCEKFFSCGGKMHQGKWTGILIDGLVGTGFKGKAEGPLAAAITSANQSGLPILAIDIPSGLNGTTGEVKTVAIKATETIFLGLPKKGFFLKSGWDHVGTLRYASFGLAEKNIALANPSAILLKEENLSLQFPPLLRTRHKYQAGYVLAIAGSASMPGAALLASSAALKAGAGIVRLFHPPEMRAQLSGAPFELIFQSWDGKNLKPLLEETIRAKALLIGPGIGKTKHSEQMVKKIFKQISLPMVIDADALFFVAKNHSWKLPQGSILTPHHGEMHRLLGKEPSWELCQAFAEKKNVTLVLKGAPTLIFHPHQTPLINTRGDPGMATAGSGDVLTGILAALLAQGLDPRRAAALGVYLHGAAGEAAACDLTSYCMTASDLIDYLAEAFKELLP